MRRVEAVDAAVVEPVREDLVPARRGHRRRRAAARARRRRSRAQRRAAQQVRVARRYGDEVCGVTGAAGGLAVGRVFRLLVSSACVQGKRFVRRTRAYTPAAGAGKRRGALVAVAAPWMRRRSRPAGRSGAGAPRSRGARRSGAPRGRVRRRRLGRRRDPARSAARPSCCSPARSSRSRFGWLAAAAARRARVARSSSRCSCSSPGRGRRSAWSIVARPELGRVQPERRVRGVPRARDRARRRRPGGSPRARRVGARARHRGRRSRGRLSPRSCPSLDPEGDRVARLREPVGYWNALALLADIALVLGLWLGASRGHRAACASPAALLVYVATLALLLTLSRVGVVAGVGGRRALARALARSAVEGGLLLAASAVPAALVGGWAFTRPALVEDVADALGSRRGRRRPRRARARRRRASSSRSWSSGARRSLGEAARRSVGRALLAVAALACRRGALAGVAVAVGGCGLVGRVPAPRSSTTRAGWARSTSATAGAGGTRRGTSSPSNAPGGRGRRHRSWSRASATARTRATSSSRTACRSSSSRTEGVVALGLFLALVARGARGVRLRAAPARRGASAPPRSRSSRRPRRTSCTRSSTTTGTSSP